MYFSLFLLYEFQGLDNVLLCRRKMPILLHKQGYMKMHAPLSFKVNRTFLKSLGQITIAFNVPFPIPCDDLVQINTFFKLLQLLFSLLTFTYCRTQCGRELYFSYAYPFFFKIPENFC